MLGLIDEYRIRVYPGLVGGGIPYFARNERREDLELLESRTVARACSTSAAACSSRADPCAECELEAAAAPCVHRTAADKRSADQVFGVTAHFVMMRWIGMYQSSSVQVRVIVPVGVLPVGKFLHVTVLRDSPSTMPAARRLLPEYR
ncbi:MAG: Dihydrofolate reductase [Frankiales bacterium]|nr:Dihydrofolate reductase [Frankiales bacterium]